MATTRTGAAAGVGAPNVSAGTEATAARPPTAAEQSRVEELLTSPSTRDRLRRDRSQLVTMPIDPTPDTAAERLARLALGQAGYLGDNPPKLDVPHPRFAEAVEAAAAAGDEERALTAATAILEGPEALEAFGLAP